MTVKLDPDSKSKTYMYVFEVPSLVQGKRRQVKKRGFRTKKEAEAAERAARVEVDRGSFVFSHKMTVEEFVREYLENKKPKGSLGDAERGHRGRLSIGTWATRKNNFEAYVIPYIGKVKLAELTNRHLERLYNTLEDSGRTRSKGGLHPNTIKKVHSDIRALLEEALLCGLVHRNVAKLVHRIEGQAPEYQVWDVDQLQTFLEAARRHPFHSRLYAGWLLFATTGMRRAEVAGLAWSDLDLDASPATLSIEATLGLVDSKQELGPAGTTGGPTWKIPKSRRSRRTIVIDGAVVAALKAWRTQQRAEQLAARDWVAVNADWRGEARADVVFTNRDGSRVHPVRWSRWLDALAADAGLPRITLHEVRHSYATAGLAVATTLADVQALAAHLGHSFDVFTRIYAHALPSLQNETTISLAARIVGRSI